MRILYLAFLYFLLNNVNAGLLCDWNGNVRDSSTFCQKGMSPSPIEFVINIGNEDCEDVLYAVTSPNYICTTCRAQDICDVGETFGKDCFCDAYCPGILKEDENGDFYCEKNANLTCPRGYGKVYVNQGFQRYYECQKGKNSDASNGNTTGGGTSGSSSGGGGGNSGGGNSGGSGNGNGPSNPNMCAKDEVGNEKECSLGNWSYIAGFDCSVASQEASAACEQIVSRTTPTPFKECPNCGKMSCKFLGESEGYYTVSACGLEWGWGMASEVCHPQSKRCNFGKCSNGKRTVPANENNVILQSCDDKPPDFGCEPCKKGGGSNNSPDSQQTCEAAGMQWVGADNGVGMCHPKSTNVGNNGGGGNGNNGGGGGNNGGGLNGNENGLTQAQLEESLSKLGEKYGKNGNGMTQVQLEESFGKAGEGLDEDIRPRVASVMESEFSTSVKELGKRLNKLLEINGQKADIAFKSLLSEQYENVSSWFDISLGDCSLLSIRFTLKIPTLGVDIDKNLNEDPYICLLLRIFSLVFQVGVYLKLIFYFLKI